MPKLLRRYGPFAAILIVIIVVALVATVFRGDDDDSGDAVEVQSNEELIRSGPMTPAKADLLGEEVDFGPNCDTETGRVKVPTVYAVPCVEPFEGDNGGATSPGVTADEILVIGYLADPAKDPLLASQVSAAGADVSPESAAETMQGYVDIINTYGEMYGRQIRLETFVGTGSYNDETAARNDAIAIAERQPFAVINGPTQASQAFATELASRGILCIGRCSLAIPQQFSEDNPELAPYLWSVGPAPEEASRLAAELIGQQAPPGPAEYAGDPELQSQERVYGAVHFETPDGRQAAAFETFEEELSANGVELAADVPYILDLARAQENARTMITKLKDAGVTSVIYYGDPITPASLTAEATAQDYFPEWIIGPTLLADTAVFARTFDQEQWSHAFGISLPSGRGEQATQPSFLVYEWFTGSPPPNNTYNVIAPDVTMVGIGITLAGPDLTPETFRDGMFRYPPSGGTIMNAGLSWGDHGFWPFTDQWGVDDGALIWWDPTAEGSSETGEAGVGLYRYANNGARYKLGEWPSKEDGGLYDDESSVTIYEEIPAEAKPPDYPSPAG